MAEAITLFGGQGAGPEDWRANAASGSRASVAVETAPAGPSLRFDFALAGHGAWAIARRELAFELPPAYVFVLRMRGAAAPAELQLKLVDASGGNVWWWRRKAFTPSPETQRIVLHRASLEFAWGPRSGGDPDRVAAVELAVASDAGAAGAFWIEALFVEPREAASGAPRARAARASSCTPGHAAEHALEADPSTCWRPAADDVTPWLELDLGERRECGGLLVDFAEASAPACRVLASEDGASWTGLAETKARPGARHWLRTGETDARLLRLALAAGAGGVAHAAVVPIELAVSPIRWATARARAAERGRYPRHLLGEHAYWALVGGDGDLSKGLLGEDGALELAAEACSVEPFLWTGDRTISWADVERSASLEDGSLPIPTVCWEAAGLRLTITPFASGAAGRSALLARYTLENLGAAACEARLFLAVRPFQVTPGWQSLNLAGGVARIERVECDGARVSIDGARTIVALSAADGFGAASSETGLAALFEGHLPGAQRADDPLGFAEAALAFDFSLAPGGRESVWFGAPFFEETPALPSGLARREAAAFGEARLAEAIAHWRERLARIPISLPPCAAPFEQSLRASVAWILVNREGPRIQPGPRCYRRSWIRDGTLTGLAIAEMGFADEARAFLRWYAPYQLADGRVPCAVDRKGVDSAVEHDSHGQLAWGVVELYRLTRDEAFLRELWPHVSRAVDAIARLRAERTGDAFRGDARFGLLPESISHEGYASNPVHSYWDDLFAVVGLSDAAFAAEALGDGAAAARIGALASAMRGDLHASIAAAIAKHAIDFIPGSVELGDFDPTSTAIALDPCGEGSRLPRAALERTFERYWAEFEARQRGQAPNDAYTPYEVRNALALLRLGWKQRAHDLLAWLIGDQRIPAWREWPEVSTKDPRAPRFLGDLPHGWVASSFVRSVRRLIAYESDDGASLVVAAGVPEVWVREAPGVRVRSLPTRFGPLDLDLLAESGARVRVRFGGACQPPDGFVLVSPLAKPLREIVIDGRAGPADDPKQVRLAGRPLEVVLVHDLEQAAEKRRTLSGC